MWKRFWDLGEGLMRWWCTDDRDPGQSERAGWINYLNYLIFFVCVCARSCFFCCCCCFSVSTGELKYGNVCDTFMHVERHFLASAVCRAGSTFSFSESVSWEGNYFPKQKSFNVAVSVNRVFTHKEKAFAGIRLKCLRKKREKSEIIFYFFRTI